jgi:hypothetical protein
MNTNQPLFDVIKKQIDQIDALESDLKLTESLQVRPLRERVVELEAFVREALMNCSIDNHGGGEDMDCEFCAKGGALLLGVRQ